MRNIKQHGFKRFSWDPGKIFLRGSNSKYFCGLLTTGSEPSQPNPPQVQFGQQNIITISTHTFRTFSHLTSSSNGSHILTTSSSKRIQLIRKINGQRLLMNCVVLLLEQSNFVNCINRSSLHTFRVAYLKTNQSFNLASPSSVAPTFNNQRQSATLDC